jgi:hypothetical protein
MSTLRVVVVATALISGCATARPSLVQPAARSRVSGTPAERLAGIPVPDPSADPDNKNQRFGIDSARERNETAQRKREEGRRCVDVVSKGDAAKGKPPCPPSNK